MDASGNIMMEWTKTVPKRIHSNPTHTDADGWSCDFCGAESFDKELFNEVGETLDCAARGKEAGVWSEEVMADADTQRAKKWLDDAKAAPIAWENVENQKILDLYNSYAKKYELFPEALTNAGARLKELETSINEVGDAMKAITTATATAPMDTRKTQLRNYHEMMTKNRLRGGR